MNDDHDHGRMDDDGAPPRKYDDTHAIRIGIPPEPAKPTLRLVGADDEPVLNDVRQPRERRRVRIPADDNGPSRMVYTSTPPSDGPSMLLGANGQPISAAAQPAELVGVNGDTLNSLTWPEYLAWRKTKCRPYNYDVGPKLATEQQPEEFLSIDGITVERALTEIDQATLEFIGEVAELGELFIDNGASTFFGEKRAKLIDECGDILFCGCWALDAWGVNPLADADDLEFLRVTDEDGLAVFAGIMAQNEEGAVLGNAKFMSMLGGMLLNKLLTIQARAGLLANSFKKLRYQRREQDVKVQVERIFQVFFHVNEILVLANSSVEEALKVNMRKLNARYPDGYQSGQGGGIRTGAGA